jgi:endonuclease/exonuclease/phosphatase family metal-dependent hydrolase
VLLLTWNVLADSYVRASYYPRAQAELLRRGARTQAIAAYLEAAAPDIACLQEVEEPVVTALAGWEVRHARKPARREGCAIASRTKLLTELVPLPHGQHALLARGALVPIATTHLRWDKPGTPRHQRQGIAEAEALIAVLRDGPWVVCGDFNVEPHDEVIELFAAAGFRDACTGALGPTSNPNGRAKRIDHVLVRGDLRCEPLPLTAVADDTPLPSHAMPSDHVPIAVRLS